MKTSTIKIIALYSLASLIWGSTWLVIRSGLNSLTPMIGAGYRFLLASLIIVIILKLSGTGIQKDKIAVRLYFYMAFFSFIIPFSLVYWGEQYVQSGLASVLFGAFPFFVAIFSFWAIPNEKIDSYKIYGIIAGFTGIIIIFSQSLEFENFNSFGGMAAIVLSAMFQATIAVSIKKYGQHLNPLSMNFVPMFIAGIVLLIIGYSIEDKSKINFDFNAIFSIVYLALFGSVVTFTSYYWLLKRVNIVIMSLMAFITPIVALILGWFIMDEGLSRRHFIGSILVLSGLLIANGKNINRLRLERKKYNGKYNTN